MRATINGVTVEGAPGEIYKFWRICKAESEPQVEECGDQQEYSKRYNEEMERRANEEREKIMGMGEIIGQSR